jgi:hypothetical protein
MVLGLDREGLVVLFHPTWVGMGWIEVGWVELGWDGSGWVKRSGGLRNPRMPEVVSRVINNTTGPAPGFTLRRRQCFVSIRWSRPPWEVAMSALGTPSTLTRWSSTRCRR